MLNFHIIMDPEKYGYVECKKCNGYGSSLKEEVDICSVCSGDGVVRKEKSEINEKETAR